jgi:hypothetical protein
VFHFEGPSQHLAPAVNAVYVWCEVGVNSDDLDDLSMKYMNGMNGPAKGRKLRDHAAQG